MLDVIILNLGLFVVHWGYGLCTIKTSDVVKHLGSIGL